MNIENIKIINFRNYNELKCSFSNKINIFYGLNGSGKTNLVEAIYLLSLTKSFRLNSDKLLIAKGSTKSVVEGEVTKRSDTSKYRITISSDGKKVEINDNKIDKISDYVSKINIILYNPSDNELIASAPSIKRKFINIEISQLHKEYLLILSNYNKLLKQN